MELTNTLRDYYSFYGVENEGPPPGLNLDKILLSQIHILSELSLLRKLLNDERYKKDFTQCKKLVENLSTKLSREARLIEELRLIKDKINIDVEGISNGIIWFRQAQETYPQHNSNDIIEASKATNLDPSFIEGLKIQGSLILQLYIALVYLREGPVSDILKIGSKNKCQIMIDCRKLINSDYIRHIRNALSHGTFKINIAGVYFIDERYEIVATPKFLDRICNWIFIIYYQCLLFAQNELTHLES